MKARRKKPLLLKTNRIMRILTHEEVCDENIKKENEGNEEIDNESYTYVGLLKERALKYLLAPRPPRFWEEPEYIEMFNKIFGN